MRIVFAGTPAFAARALRALLDAAFEIALVVTRPDSPSGRGMRLGASAVKELAQASGVPLYQPVSLREEQAIERIEAARPEVIVVVAYGLILPERVLQAAPLGALNIHASLLPRWRGAAPIQRALLAGDRETGITIMQMDAGLDTGPVLAQRRVTIAAHDDAATLHDRLAALGAEMIVTVLAEVAAGTARAVAQSEGEASYASKLEKHEMQIDWSRRAPELERTVRALHPVPGAHSTLRGEALKIWSAHCGAGEGRPGTVLRADASGVVIACGEGALVVTELQRPGGRRLAVADFVRGFPIGRGEQFGAAR